MNLLHYTRWSVCLVLGLWLSLSATSPAAYGQGLKKTSRLRLRPDTARHC